MKKKGSWDQLKFVTGNPNKVKEAQQILGIPLEQVNADHVIEMQTNNLFELVEHKVKQAYEIFRSPVMVEDSGLIFNAWKSLPGALIKWFENSVGCDGMIKMLESFEDKTATALCFLAVYDGRKIKVVKGEVHGKVSPNIRGVNGFGWDVLFIPDGHQRTFAEMSAEEKNAISHRKKAFDQLKKTFLA